MTREEAIGALSSEKEAYILNIDGKPTICYSAKLIQALEMAIEALQMDQTWIPVFMKLPKEQEKPYWVCLDDGYQCECRWTNDMYGIGTNEWSEWGWHIMDKPQYSRVVAWKPLPESYKTKEGE